VIIETIVFVIGCVLGVFTVIAIQKVYDWIDKLSTRVKSLRREHAIVHEDIELWYEFNDWKRMQKGKE